MFNCGHWTHTQDAADASLQGQLITFHQHEVIVDGDRGARQRSSDAGSLSNAINYYRKPASDRPPARRTVQRLSVVTYSTGTGVVRPSRQLSTHSPPSVTAITSVGRKQSVCVTSPFRRHHLSRARLTVRNRLEKSIYSSIVLRISAEIHVRIWRYRDGQTEKDREWRQTLQHQCD